LRRGSFVRSASALSAAGLPLAADRIDEARNAGRREGAEEAGRGWEAVEARVTIS